MRVGAETFAFGRLEHLPSDDAAMGKDFDGVFLAAVADGLGSAKRGGEAARRAIDLLTRNFPARPHAWTAGKTVEEITRHLNRCFYQEGLARFEATELATTIATVALEGQTAYLLNAGDSRIYLWRANRLTRLSIDHREAQPTAPTFSPAPWDWRRISNPRRVNCQWSRETCSCSAPTG